MHLAPGENEIGAKQESARLGCGHSGRNIVRVFDEASFDSDQIDRLGPSLAPVPRPEHDGLSAYGTLPWEEAEQRIDFSLQETFPHQAAHLAPAIRTLHASISLSADDEIPDSATRHPAIFQNNDFQ